MQRTGISASSTHTNFYPNLDIFYKFHKIIYLYLLIALILKLITFFA